MTSVKTKSLALKTFSLLGIALIFASCKTKVNAGGIVLSKHGVPVPGATAELGYSVGGRSEEVGSIRTITNGAGKFAFVNKSTGHSHATIERARASFPDSGSVSLGPSEFVLGPDMELQLK